MTKQPTSSGLDGITVAETAISDVDGERGRLVIAGSDVEQLAAGSSYEAAVTRVLGAANGAQGDPATFVGTPQLLLYCAEPCPDTLEHAGGAC